MSKIGTILTNLSIAALHFALAKAGLLTSFLPAGPTPIWPPAGYSLSVLLIPENGFAKTWWDWWLPNALSDLVFAPFLLTWASSRTFYRGPLCA